MYVIWLALEKVYEKTTGISMLNVCSFPSDGLLPLQSLSQQAAVIQAFELGHVRHRKSSFPLHEGMDPGRRCAVPAGGASTFPAGPSRGHRGVAD